jgi:hypothetical protein
MRSEIWTQEAKNMRNKDNGHDCEKYEYCNEHRSCSDVFGIARVGMMVGACEVHVHFHGGVQCFDHEKHPERYDERERLPCRDPKVHAEKCSDHTTDDLNPSVVSIRNKNPDTAERMLKAQNARDKTESLLFFLVHMQTV